MQGLSPVYALFWTNHILIKTLININWCVKWKIIYISTKKKELLESNPERGNFEGKNGCTQRLEKVLLWENSTDACNSAVSKQLIIFQPLNNTKAISSKELSFLESVFNLG